MSMAKRAFVDKWFFINLEKWSPEAKAQAEKDPGGPYHRALYAVDEALVATISHMKAQRDKKRPKTTPESLARLWLSASRALSGIDDDFAYMCQHKALGWVDEEMWAKADDNGVDTNIESITKKRDSLSRTSKPGAPTGLWSYIDSEDNRKRLAFVGAFIAAVAFAIWTVFVFVIEKDTKAAEAKKPQVAQSTQAPSVTVNPVIKNEIQNNPTINIQPTPPPPAPSLTIKAELVICEGEYEKNCRSPHTHFAYCGQLAQVAAKECQALFKQFTLQSSSGNKCGYRTVRIMCEARSN